MVYFLKMVLLQDFNHLRIRFYMAKIDNKMEKGQKRMIHIKIWQNESFATMNPLARLLYIGLVVLADDDGRLKGNSTLLKSQIFPFDAEMTLDDFKKLLKEVLKSKLIEIYRINGEYFMSHPNWKRYQYIRADLYKPSIFPENPLQICNEDVTEKGTKKRKEKKRKDNEENTISYFSNIPENDMQEFLNRFAVGKSKVLSKAEDFLLYCKSKAKWYDDPKSAFLNAMKKDFPKREIKTVEDKKKIAQDLDTERYEMPKNFRESIKNILADKNVSNLAGNPLEDDTI